MTYVVRDMSHGQETVETFEADDDNAAIERAKRDTAESRCCMALICTDTKNPHFVQIF